MSEPETLKLMTANPIPRGFRPITKTPRIGKDVVVILTNGKVAIASFGPVVSPDPAFLLAQAFQIDGKPVTVRCWRPIPKNWM